MQLSDLSICKGEHVLGPEHSLTVVTDTPEVDSQWFIPRIAGENTVLVTMSNSTLMQSKKAPKYVELLDLSSDLFSLEGGQFKPPNLDLLARKIIAKSPRTVILEHPDVLLASGLVDSTELMDLVHRILEVARLVVTTRISDAVLTSPLGVSYATKNFITNLLHQSYVVCSIRPLSTGRAQDTTGVVRISAGPRALPGDVASSEFLYLVNAQFGTTLMAR